MELYYPDAKGTRKLQVQGQIRSTWPGGELSSRRVFLGPYRRRHHLGRQRAGLAGAVSGGAQRVAIGDGRLALLKNSRSYSRTTGRQDLSGLNRVIWRACIAVPTPRSGARV